MYNYFDNRSGFIRTKGFTLIELLAVIVIIVIIAVITVPLILRVIDKSKKGALEDSAYGIISSGELFLAQSLSSNINDSEVLRYDFKIKNNKFVYTEDETKELSFKGTVPKNGMLQINTNGKVAIAICTNDYCACKSINELKVTIKDSNCNIDSETGEIMGEGNSTSGESNPVGTVISYMGKIAPSGYLFCDGSVYNISDYPNLANQIKEQFGSYNYYGGDGIDTFAVPNLQGEFLRGYSSDSSKSVTPGIITEEVGKHQDGTQIPKVWIYGSGTINTLVSEISARGVGNQEKNPDKSFITPTRFFKDAGSNSYTSSPSSAVYAYTIRPTNTSVLYSIKY